VAKPEHGARNLWAHIEEQERFLAALGVTNIFSQLKKEQEKS
jgi:hypothetical protein